MFRTRKSRIRVAIIGVGYMGALHADKYRSIEGVEVVAVVDPKISRAQRVGDALNCRYFESIDALFSAEIKFDAASVATPTALHFSIAGKLLARDIHCLVEKPIAQNSSEAHKLVQIARRKSRILIPGLVERFNPAVRAVWLRKPDIKYVKAYRVGPMSFRSTDIDVVRDVMIHDIDIVLFLTQSRVMDVSVCRAVAAPEGIYDIANAHLRLGSGCVADLTASRLAIARRRKLRMFTSDGYYSLDCGKRRAVYVERERYCSGVRELRFQQELGRTPEAEDIFTAVGAEWITERGGLEDSDPLQSEIKYFLDEIRGTNRESVVSPEDGILSLKVADEILGRLHENAVMELGCSIR